MEKQIKTIGVLTSGGDAPGMNAAVRAVVRTGLHKGFRMIGIQRGYNGLLNGECFEMNLRSVSNIISAGGTILYTARCLEFKTKEGQDKGAEKCRELGIDALVVIGGDGAGANAKAYTIKSVSSDGKTITVDEDTPIMESTTISPNDDVTFATSFPVGSVINMEGFGSNTVPRVQVTGISDDGTTLYVTADPGYLPAEGNPQVIDASGKWSMETQSYYQGGTLSSSKMISDNQSLTFDINGQDAVFEQMFRALGQIAQGNLVDTRNPADGTDSLINSDQAMDRVMGSLDLIQNALFNSSADTSTSNPDLYSILAKTNSNTVLLNNVTENQTLVKNNLENNISSLKNVDKTEAATKLLLAVENLQASYSVMQTTMSLSILDYLK